MDLEEARIVLERLGSVKFKSTNRGFLTNCPLKDRHKNGDKNPSMNVFSGDPTICYCFSCKFKGKLFFLAKDAGASSDLLDYIDGAEGLDLIKRAGHLPDYETVPYAATMLSDKERKAQNRLRDIQRRGGWYYYAKEEKSAYLSNIQENELSGWLSNPYPAYLTERGITQATTEKWGIGYDDIGLVGLREKETEDGSRTKYFLSIGERVVFSIRDQSGKTVGWSKRTIHDEKRVQVIRKWKDDIDLVIIRGGNCKYYHMPGFDKKKYLYGMDLIDLERSRTCIAMEGFTDVLNLWQHGLPNVLGCMGGDFSDWQLSFMVRNFDRVVFFPDGDQAGLTTVETAFQKISGHVDVKIAGWIDKKDPDSYDAKTVYELLAKTHKKSVRSRNVEK